MLGRSHATLKRIRSLRRERKIRDAEGAFVAEGLHLAQEALGSRATIELAVVSPALERIAEGAALRLALERAGVRVEETTDAILEGLQDARSPQPVVLVVRSAPLGIRDAVPGRAGTPLVVLAHAIQDPGSLGAILRSADAAGASGLVATGDGADLLHPRTVRATMGSIFRLPAASGKLDDAIDRCRAEGLAVVASSVRAGVAHHAADLRGPLAILLGAEGSGLPSDVEAGADLAVHIPMRPGVESLSVAAAAAVLLFESSRQRSVSSGR
jgi:TrmH family RNA methyltransferase